MAIVSFVLRTRGLRWLLDRRLCEIRYTSARGRAVALPVAYRRAGEGALLVTVGRAGRKTWWRHFRHGPRPCRVLLRGRVVPATAEAVGTAPVTVFVTLTG
ncbi:hypothetical protein [Spirilliplanes yamanashiensis]|uniref:DUF385 domain-containing protein n=1 Tax=Spirilliplanes yamanashiensis TaxID=42233 RepID=A0A8J4DIY3_9ACTN|nr:hypothetical protein [Spirilliplanes yamanashiensis]MDP9817528.1 hypothetical protein [Spirilliplanes yamanashiensis]GIJ02819.1 hypothetical protein Sya03_21710 [Spirilliplanes yamanashiensis]